MNIKANHLNPYGLHLNKQGFTKLAGNFIEYLKHCNLQLISVPTNAEEIEMALIAQCHNPAQALLFLHLKA
jgi:hypothetical protein